MPLKKPLIGLTPACDNDDSGLNMRTTYMRAVAMAGGLPVVLPLEATSEDIQQMAQSFDGFIFTGGPDIQPFLFGEETIAGCGPASPQRDLMEMDLFHNLLDLGKPIMGISRGLEIMNVALGGTLYQDIVAQIKADTRIAHEQPSQYTIASHSVEILQKTPVHSVIQSQIIQVNSLHHQSIRDLAAPLEIAGYAPDGIIESVYMPDKNFCIGVQWHPEYLWPSDHAAASLFVSFVAAAKGVAADIWIQSLKRSR